ncbi:hypothetical protein GCM10010254_75820 [Streptomyces chromofuscus]|nr:hypothetical protein GCM10010254_75820 [Streptomyces chromofuscus]
MVIRHVWFDSPGSDTGADSSLNGEWVEIKNTGGSAISLRGWVLKDKANHTYVFPNVKIGAGKTLKVRTGVGSDTASNKYQDRGWYVWNNTSDTATLTKANGTRVDSCSWTTRDPSDTWC